MGKQFRNFTFSLSFDTKKSVAALHHSPWRISRCWNWRAEQKKERKSPLPYSWTLWYNTALLLAQLSCVGHFLATWFLHSCTHSILSNGILKKKKIVLTPCIDTESMCAKEQTRIFRNCVNLWNLFGFLVKPVNGLPQMSFQLLFLNYWTEIQEHTGKRGNIFSFLLNTGQFVESFPHQCLSV